MKKNYYWRLLTIMMVTVLSGCFVACGDDDDDDPSNPPNDVITKIDPAPEKLRPFLGQWRIEASDQYHHVTFPNYYILFFQDGKCHAYNYDTHSSGWYSYDYDEANKYLSLAGLSKGQWQITSISDEAWSGLALWNSSNNAYSAKKQIMSAEELLLYVLEYRSTWTCDTLTAKYKPIESGRGYIEFSKQHLWKNSEKGTSSMTPYRLSLSSINFFEDTSKDVFVISQEAHEGDNKVLWDMKFVHPYSYKDCYMIIKVQDPLNGNWSGYFYSE